jgi:hypothetical protein
MTANPNYHPCNKHEEQHFQYVTACDLYYQPLINMRTTPYHSTVLTHCRENYSYQLRDYLASKGIDHRTCIIAYALKGKDIENKFIALRKKYVEKGNFDVKYIASSDFVFKAIAPMENYDEIEAKNKAEQKKKKKEDRKRPPMGGPNQGEHGGNFGGGAPGGNGGMPPMR